jgi:DNA-binding MarR family transcriptional regulator
MSAVQTKCVCIRARRGARAITDLYDAALKPAGIKITQFSVLRNVARLQPVSISRLATEMGLDRSTLGRNLLLLRRRGLVVFSDADDMRQWSIELSDKARKLLARALPLWQSAQAKMEGALGREGVTTLFDLLQKVEMIR